MFDAELDALKRVDLRLYAAANGFVLDKRESWRGSAVMRHPNGDKVIIKLNAGDGHYLWFSVRTEANGTILDFVHYLKGGSRRSRMDIGAIRKELRPWIGRSPLPVPNFEPLYATAKDRLKVELEYAKTSDALRHSYLEDERALPAWVLRHERFAGTIRIDARGNACFPHSDAEGICGIEKKNKNYTSFSSGGEKGLWLSREFPEDARLAVFESSIDALSYAVLNPDEHTRYASIAGKPSPKQPELIRAAVARMPAGSAIIAAMDNDDDGRKLADVVRKAVELTGRADLTFRAHLPDAAKDWNDVLRARPLPPSSGRPKEAAPQ